MSDFSSETNIDVIIQARIDSKRLPRKVLKMIEGKPLIAHIIDRLRLSVKIRNIIIATVAGDSAIEIQKALSDYHNQVEYFIGSENNVLERYYQAAKAFNSQHIVRATADNPLVSPFFMDKAIEIHLENEADLTHFLGIPLGTGVEVISMAALENTYINAHLKYDLEHVTAYLYSNAANYNILEPCTKGKYFIKDFMDKRVTVDTEEDLRFVRNIFSHYQEKKFIFIEDVIDYFNHFENR